MGCLLGKLRRESLEEEEEVEEPPKQYSWDKRPKVNPNDFIIQNLTGETTGRLPGTVNGQQFIIQNCKDCNIYIFDHIATATVDDCTNCRIFLGPIKTSVFLRDCSDCKFVLSCQQFRTRDCRKLDVFLSCITQPIIESTTSIKFGCFQYNYTQLTDQFKSAGLSVFNNNWSNIHDFTPVPGEANHGLLPENAQVQDFVPLPQAEPFTSIAISTAEGESIIPKTAGLRRKISDEGCFVAWFHNDSASKNARSFMDEMRQKHSAVRLMRTCEMKLEASHAERVFGGDMAALTQARLGPVIALEYSGDNCVETCQMNAKSTISAAGSSTHVHVSADAQHAAQELDNFYNLIDMQMSV